MTPCIKLQKNVDIQNVKKGHNILLQPLGKYKID